MIQSRMSMSSTLHSLPINKMTVYKSILGMLGERWIFFCCEACNHASCLEGQYIKEKERNSIDSKIRMYETRSAEYIRIYESIEFCSIFDLKYTK